MKKNVILSETREVPLLLFLWKWKVVSTAALIRKFFPNCAGKTAYNRILVLRQANLIRVKADGQGQKFVCTLDQNGFDAIRGYLPYLKEEGFKSESLGHDLVSSAFHLGNWLNAKPEKASLFSEQELRRVDPEFFPSWVPRTDIHRPDGYTQIEKEEGPQTFAIEVELTYKREADYVRIAEFYSQFRGIKKVLWLVTGEPMAINLSEKMRAPLHNKESHHNFILFQEFRKSGWAARVAVGPDQDQSLSDVLWDFPPKADQNLADSSLIQSLLDTRKSPHIASVYRGYGIGDFAD